jgi:FAD synthase
MEVRTYPDLSLPVGLRFPLTLGNFDGVHLGHRALVAELKEQARGVGTPSVAVTFRHPVTCVPTWREAILTPKQRRPGGLGWTT